MAVECWDGSIYLTQATNQIVNMSHKISWNRESKIQIKNLVETWNLRKTKTTFGFREKVWSGMQLPEIQKYNAENQTCLDLL